MKTNAVIIEDEAASRETLSRYLGKYCPEIEVVGMAQNIIEGQKVINDLTPRLLFLDVEMPHGNAFDLLEKYPNAPFEVIFVTAFSHYAIKALNMSAAWYLLKPVNITELMQAVEKATARLSHPEPELGIPLLLENLTQKKDQEMKLALPLLEGFEVVRLKQIVMAKAEDNFSMIYLEDGTKRLICRSLKYYTDLLENAGFMRAHKSYLVNLEHVVKYNKGKGGSLLLTHDFEAELAPARKELFFERFKALGL